MTNEEFALIFPGSPISFAIDLSGAPNDTAFHGKCLFTADRENRFYFSEVIENPTWKDVARCAIDAYAQLEDHDHDCLEQVVKLRRSNGITMFDFYFSS